MATVSDEDAEFYAAQETLFDHLAPLPFASFSFEIDTDSGFVDSRRQDWEITNVEILHRYTWNGLEDEVRGGEYQVDFTQDEGVWSVTDDSMVDRDSFFFLAPFLFEYTDHFLLFYHADFADLAEEIEELLESEYDSLGGAVTAATGAGPAQLYVVYLASNEGEFDVMAGSGAGSRGVAYSETRLGPEGFAVVRRSIHFNGGVLREEGAESFRQLVRTVLAHAFLDTITRPYSPPWVAEGAVMWLTGEGTDWDLLREARGDGRLDDVTLEGLTARSSLRRAFSEFGLRGYVAVRFAYTNAVTHYLIENFGEDTYWVFYLSYSQVPWEEIEPHIPDFWFPAMGNRWENVQITLTDEFVRDFFGLSEAQLDDEVKAWIDEELET